MSDLFMDHGAVVELKHRPPLHRIDRGKGLRALLHRAEIDLLGRHCNALLGQENAHPARIGGASAVVEFHCAQLPVPLSLCSSSAYWGNLTWHVRLRQHAEWRAHDADPAKSVKPRPRRKRMLAADTANP